MKTVHPALLFLFLALAVPLLGPAAGAPPARAQAPAAVPPPALPPPSPMAAGRVGPAGSGAAPPDFAERVVVHEVGVVVELPSPLRRSRLKSLAAQDFVVLEEGGLRTVVRAAPVAAGEAAPWQVVLYFDRVLAKPDTVYFTANSLAKQADQLTGLGAVDVVVADPQWHVVLSGCREPRLLEVTLTDLAADAARQRDGGGAAARAKAGSATAAGGGAAAGTGAAGPRLAELRRQMDGLMSVAAGRRGGGPRALVLVIDDFDTAATGAGAATALMPVAEEAGRTLAAYGWVTLVAPLRRQPLRIDHPETSEVERSRQLAAGPTDPGPGYTLPKEILPQTGHETRLNYDSVLDLFVRPAGAALTAIASVTGGTVVGSPELLSASLDGLARRWQLSYLAPDSGDGKPQRVEVRLQPDGTLLRAPLWRRSSTPEEVAAARLREALAGGTEQGGLPLTAALRPDQSAQLRLAAGALAAGDALPAGPFRLSLAYDTCGAAAPSLEHRLLARADAAGQSWSDTVALTPPPGARRVAVEVEDLGHEAWGIAVTALPSAAGPCPPASPE